MTPVDSVFPFRRYDLQMFTSSVHGKRQGHSLDNKSTNQRRMYGWRTCKQIPEIIRLDGLLVTTATYLPVADAVASDEAVLGVCLRWQPVHFDALKHTKKVYSNLHKYRVFTKN